MRYVCTRCGEILSEDNAVKNPDGDIECEACYLENKSDWFEEEEGEAKQSGQEGSSESDDLNYGSGSDSEKKSFWKR